MSLGGLDWSCPQPVKLDHDLPGVLLTPRLFSSALHRFSLLEIASSASRNMARASSTEESCWHEREKCTKNEKTSSKPIRLVLPPLRSFTSANSSKLKCPVTVSGGDEGMKWQANKLHQAASTLLCQLTHSSAYQPAKCRNSGWLCT